MLMPMLILMLMIINNNNNNNNNYYYYYYYFQKQNYKFRYTVRKLLKNFRLLLLPCSQLGNISRDMFPNL